METTGAADPLPSEVEPSPLHLVTLTRVSLIVLFIHVFVFSSFKVSRLSDDSNLSFSTCHLQSYGGNVWWLKKILWEFGMYASPLKNFPEHQRAIVPNTPENNKKLAKVGV